MHAKDLLVDDGRDWQTVETVGKRLPQFDVVSSLALVIEAVDSVDGRTLVVASEKEEVLRVLDLVREKEADGLQTLLSSINIVSEEKVICLRREATVLEQSQQIVVLTMDITTDLDWSLQLKKDGLVDEDVSRLDAQSTNFLLRKLHLFSWSAPNKSVRNDSAM